MAQAGSQVQHVERLSRDVERLKLENTTVRSELAVEKHQAETWREKLDIQQKQFTEERQNLEQLLNQARQEKDDQAKTMEMLRATWQAQIDAHGDNNRHHTEVLQKVKSELEMVYQRHFAVRI